MKLVFPLLARGVFKAKGNMCGREWICVVIDGRIDRRMTS